MSKVCAGCGGKITTAVLTAEGKDWHVECFKCDICTQPLAQCGAGSYTQKDGKRVCEGCKPQLQPVPSPSKACAGCGGKITSATLTAENKDWHPECFKCDFCKQPLDQCGGSYTQKDGKRACAGCKTKLKFAAPSKVCFGCGGQITSQTLTAENKDWHPECFKCEFCEGPLVAQGGVVSYAHRDGKRACECCKTKHQPAPPKCDKCGKAVHGERLVSPDNKKICSDCAPTGPCGKCGKQVTFQHLTKGALISDGTVYHKDCWESECRTKQEKTAASNQAVYEEAVKKDPKPVASGRTSARAPQKSQDEVACAVCGEHITAGQAAFKLLDGKNLHNDCFKCSLCGEKLDPANSSVRKLLRSKVQQCVDGTLKCDACTPAQKTLEEPEAQKPEKDRMVQAKADDKAEAAKTPAEAAAPAASAAALIYPLEVLRTSIPEGVRANAKENHLSPEDFRLALGMDRAAFAALPKWKQKKAKEDAGIY